MLFNILRHTPSWVWLVLALLLWRGFALTRPQRISSTRTALLPALFAALSLGGVVSAFGLQAGALLCWLGGLTLSAYETQRHGPPPGAEYRPEEQGYHLPGSWAPLLLIVLIFAVKYGVAVALALHPQLHAIRLFALLVGAALGALSGVFIGRALRLLHLRHSQTLVLNA